MEEESDYLKARRGDHLLVEFECDVCVFRKLKRRDPLEGLPADDLTLKCIRRANLDAFWSRAPSTAVKNARATQGILDACTTLEIIPPFKPSGPMPNHDHCGYAIAVSSVLLSTGKGRYQTSHKQFATVRQYRTAFSNQLRATAGQRGDQLVMSDHDGKGYNRLSSDPCGSLWFHRFMEGMKRRMGQDWRPNQAITPELLVEILARMENDIRTSSLEKGFDLTVTAIFFVTCYVLSLRGPEGVLLDTASTIKHFESNKNCITIGLWGKVKGETSPRAHLLPCTYKTKSGIDVALWWRRGIALSLHIGRTSGPLMIDYKGRILNSARLTSTLHHYLLQILDESPNVLPSKITSAEEITERYHTFRSFRRGSDTRALAMKVDENDIYCVNRWKSEGRNQRGPGAMPMHHRYADIDLLIQPFLRYTSAM